MPDIAHRTIDEVSVDDVRTEIETALINFEPRLVARTHPCAARRCTVDASELKVRFVVQADLRCEPVERSGRVRRRCRTRQRHHPDQPALATWTGNFSISTIENCCCCTSRPGSLPRNIRELPSGLAGWLRERMDPMIAGLLEGAAFLAARVQLKLKHEFPEFTSNLLEQLIPNYLAPTPSVMLAKVLPPYADPKLREGYAIARGAYLDATYRERDRQIACRYRLSSDIVLWPFDIDGRGVLHDARRRCRRSAFRSGTTSSPDCGCR